MNSSRINDWLTLIANVAVVGGIVFLAIELRQNNKLLRPGWRTATSSCSINDRPRPKMVG